VGDNLLQFWLCAFSVRNPATSTQVIRGDVARRKKTPKKRLNPNHDNKGCSSFSQHPFLIFLGFCSFCGVKRKRSLLATPAKNTSNTNVYLGRYTLGLRDFFLPPQHSRDSPAAMLPMSIRSPLVDRIRKVACPSSLGKGSITKKNIGITPLKIDREHNHGGLEDHFPF